MVTMDHMDPTDVVIGTVMTAVAFITDEDDMLISDTLRRTHRYWMRTWYLDRLDGTHVNTMYKFQNELLQLGDVDEFRATLRMPPNVYEDLLESVRPLITKMDTNYRKCITAEERLSLTIRYLVLGESFRSLRQAYRIGLCTVGRVIRETCEAIYKTLQPQYLKTPETLQDWMEIEAGFRTRWNFPHVCGSLDGKHIRIVAPPKSGSFFFNYKHYFSIILMALVDADYKFLYVDVGAEGKASDGGIWKNCSLCELLMDEENVMNFPQPGPIAGIEVNVPFFLVGDDAFALSHQLMKPFPIQNLSMKERIFNYRLSRSRMVVENAFGILSTKFRIFRRDIEMSPEGVEKIVLASVVLHNLLRKRCGYSYMPPRAVDWIDEDHIRQRGMWRGENPLDEIEQTRNRNPTQYAKRLRDRLSDYFVQKEGEVIWQYSASIIEKSFK